MQTCRVPTNQEIWLLEHNRERGKKKKGQHPKKIAKPSFDNPIQETAREERRTAKWESSLLFRTLHQETADHSHKTSKETPRKEEKGKDFEECSYIRGAPGVVYGSGEENPPLAVDKHRLLVVRHRAFDGGRQHGHRHRAAEQGSRPPPPHGQPPTPTRWPEKKTARAECARVCERPRSSHTGLPLQHYAATTSSSSSLQTSQILLLPAFLWILGFFGWALGRSASGGSCSAPVELLAYGVLL